MVASEVARGALELEMGWNRNQRKSLCWYHSLLSLVGPLPKSANLRFKLADLKLKWANLNLKWANLSQFKPNLTTTTVHMSIVLRLIQLESWGGAQVEDFRADYKTHRVVNVSIRWRRHTDVVLSLMSKQLQQQPPCNLLTQLLI